MISGAAGGSGSKIYRWKRYNVNNTTTYKWNKYNRVSTTTYRWNKWNAVSTTTYIWNKWSVDIAEKYELHTYPNSFQFSQGASISKCFTGYNLDENTGRIWFTGGPFECYVANNPNKLSSSYIVSYESSGGIPTNPYGTGFYSGFRFTGKYSAVDSTRPLYDAYHTESKAVSSQVKGSTSYGQVSSTSSTAYPNGGVSGDYWYDGRTSSVKYSKGTTSYGQVTSSSSSAYPSNGVSGSYWYESAGSSTSYSKGSTSYGQVSSTNRSAYPDNSYSGSYWYVYSTSSVSHSQGSYVDEVFAVDSSKYPQNGRSGSYWYVYDGEAN